jgi:hypothetical protein
MMQGREVWERNGGLTGPLDRWVLEGTGREVSYQSARHGQAVENSRNRRAVSKCGAWTCTACLRRLRIAVCQISTRLERCGI